MNFETVIKKQKRYKKYKKTKKTKSFFITANPTDEQFENKQIKRAIRQKKRLSLPRIAKKSLIKSNKKITYKNFKKKEKKINPFRDQQYYQPAKTIQIEKQINKRFVHIAENIKKTGAMNRIRQIGSKSLKNFMVEEFVETDYMKVKKNLHYGTENMITKVDGYLSHINDVLTFKKNTPRVIEDHKYDFNHIKHSAFQLLKIENQSQIQEADEIFKLQKSSIKVASMVQKEKNRIIEKAAKDLKLKNKERRKLALQSVTMRKKTKVIRMFQSGKFSSPFKSKKKEDIPHKILSRGIQRLQEFVKNNMEKLKNMRFNQKAEEVKQSKKFSSKMYLSSEEYQSRKKWKFPISKNLTLKSRYKEVPLYVKSTSQFFPVMVKNPAIFRKKQEELVCNIEQKLMYKTFGIERQIEKMQRFHVNRFDKKIELKEIQPIKNDKKYLTILGKIVSDESQHIIKKDDQDATDLLYQLEAKKAFSNMKFFRTYMHQRKVAGKTPQIYEVFADECQKQAIFPINFMQYMTEKSLILENYHLRQENLKAIGTVVKEIKDMDLVILTNNNMDDAMVAYFMKFLAKTKLKKLNISGNSLGRLSCRSLYHNFLMTGNKLIDLNLNNCRVQSIYLEQFFEDMTDKGTCLIKYLSMSNVGFSDSSLESLIRLFNECHQLYSIDVSRNNFTEEQSRRFFEALPDCSTLKHLNYSYNSLRSADPKNSIIKKFSEDLFDITCLHHLHLDHCSITKKDLTYLLYGMKLQHSLLSVHLTGNCFESCMLNDGKQSYSFPFSIEEMYRMLNENILNKNNNVIGQKILKRLKETGQTKAHKQDGTSKISEKKFYQQKDGKPKFS